MGNLMSTNIELLVDRHKDAVYRQMVRVCGNCADADDALAEAILSAFEFGRTLRDPSAFQPWLSKIAQRCCARIQVRRTVGATLVEGALSKSVSLAASDAFSEAEIKECVLDAVGKLKAGYRDVYMSCEVEGCSLQETAERLGISITVAKTRLHRARELVRNKLGESLNAK